MTAAAQDIPISAEDAHRAAERAAGDVRRTPMLRCGWLSERLGADVRLKCENLQRTGSFKIRGALAALSASQPQSVVAASAGNHGQALALAADARGIRCSIVVPRSVPRVKAEAITRLGATLVMPPSDYPRGETYDGAEAYMLEHAPDLAERVISAFEDPDVVAGNGGALALEALDQLPTIDTFVVPCGGGGCVGGVGTIARAQSRPVRTYGVNTDASPGMWRSFRDGYAHLAIDDGELTVADGIEGGVRPSSFGLCRRVIDDVVLAREATVRTAVALLAKHERLIVEGAGAAGVAALLDGAIEARGQSICVVLTGGNIDAERLAALLDDHQEA